MDQSQINEIRVFNRFYTKFIGLLDKHVLNSAYSLPEARILFELYREPGLTASDLIRLLDVDKGYLSRMLKRFEKGAMLRKQVSAQDRRVVHLSLSESGKAEYERLDRASSEHIRKIFRHYSMAEIRALINHMQGIQNLINKSS
ncbi:MarR family winged helix-turn-helix transcriptional regulator [Flavilitoribacter nigricans]|uniref:MarR family transcriptional regulator n=1 Tax=Flavilitoribacter nigricans (strain ATCC 23147 / DSM 23189 / NBRC 102662 / NCIMB 1420 / SS-2) TaxID=1122177 RepID=A0A2D0NID8_FLAN2|nr:MarR family transcriptional regulator [Flavilitoribacter nigricans]PHN08136.1 MarR family transcriptional regulator [Flavilitoribacter nigricans DSM 23189 = NBRC 102662]